MTQKAPTVHVPLTSLVACRKYTFPLLHAIKQLGVGREQQCDPFWFSKYANVPQVCMSLNIFT